MTCAAGALILGGSRVQAAAAAATTSSAAAEPTTIGEIVVTAERREASLQEVPEAVTAFTAQDRNLKGINTVQDITDFTPGLTYSSQLDRPAMRGISKNNNIYTTDSGVAIYYDDFYSNSTFLVGRDDMLIDQVEVLLGPQGTLYGRNSVGGLINTITKRPSDQFGGEVRAIVGNYGYTKFEGTITGPITDHLSVRASFYDLNQYDGYFTNLVPGKPSEGGVAHDPYGDLQFQYKDNSNDVWLDLNDISFNHDRGGPGSLLGVPTGGAYDTSPVTSGNIFFNPNFPYGGGAVPGSVVGELPGNNPADNNIRDFAHAIPTDIYVHGAYSATFHAVHHFDGFDVKYVTGYSQYHYDLSTQLFDYGNSPITQYQIPLAAGGECASLAAAYGPAECSPLTVDPSLGFTYDIRSAWWSQEVTISSTTNNPLQWIAGLYYYHEDDNNPEFAQALGQSQLATPGNLDGTAAAPNPNRYYAFYDYQSTIQSYAAYGQLDWKITPTLKLTGGVRFTYDQKTAEEEERLIGFLNASGGTGFLAGTPGVPAAYELPAGAGVNAPNLGSLLPALDLTADLSNPLIFSGAPIKGVTCAPTLATSGQFAGDYTRCLGDHSSAPTGTAGIEWTPDNETLVYVRYNRGYKAFGFNAGDLSATPEAAPEYVDDFEGGFKKTFGHTLVVDADAFYYNYHDAQIPLPTPTGAIDITQFYNVPSAVSDGVELTADWRPIRHLDMSLTYGFDHTEILSSCTDVGGVATGACYVDAADPNAAYPGAHPVGGATSSGSFFQSVRGAELPQAPENKVAFNTNYTWEFQPGNLTFSATYIWRDKSYASVFTRVYDEAPSWSQVDLRALWSGDHDRYEVILYVKNLFNTLGYDAATAGYLSGTTASATTGTINNYTQVPSFDLTPPRLFGIELHYKF
jgi:iron complex outermembrane receptor protein